MPVDDPGWGDYTPLPEEPQPPQTQPQPPAEPRAPEAAPPPRPSGGGPSGFTPVRIALAAVVLVVLGVAAFFVFSGDDPEEASDRRPLAAVSDEDASPGDPAPEEETPDEAIPTAAGDDAPTTDEYIASADRICKRFTGQIQTASQDNDIARLVELYGMMIGRLRLQELPAGEDGDVIDGMLSDFEQAVEALPNDYETALTFASAAQTTAYQMGFDDCAEA